MNLRDLAPNAKLSILLSAGFAALTIGLYFSCVNSAAARLARSCEARDGLKQKLELQAHDLNSADRVATAITELEKALAPYRLSLLQPLLESMAMRAKFDLDPLALASGLKNVEYEALAPLALPSVKESEQAKPAPKQTKPAPKQTKPAKKNVSRGKNKAKAVKKQPFPLQQHIRQPIRIVAQGSFQAAVSFLLRVEQQYPLVILQSLTVTSQQDPLRQQIEMTLEWPARGKAVRP